MAKGGFEAVESIGELTFLKAWLRDLERFSAGLRSPDEAWQTVLHSLVVAQELDEVILAAEAASISPDVVLEVFSRLPAIFLMRSGRDQMISALEGEIVRRSRHVRRASSDPPKLT
jgi:hypothetical protein